MDPKDAHAFALNVGCQRLLNPACPGYLMIFDYHAFRMAAHTFALDVVTDPAYDVLYNDKIFMGLTHAGQNQRNKAGT